MHTQLKGIESILKVVWFVDHQNKFITRLHLYIIFVIYLEIRLEACSFTKNEPLNRYFLSILSAISPGFCKSQFHLASIFKNTSLPQNTFNRCISCFSCSMIQKIMRELIKLETAYFLHGRCHYLRTYSQLGTLRRSEIKLRI